MSRRLALFVVVTLVGTAWPASAQTRPAPAARGPQRQPPATFAASGHVGLGLFAAADSFKAVLGSRSGTVFGGGGEARLRSGLFVGVRVSRFQETGSRVFVDQGQRFDLGIPTTVTITPVEAVVGYRMVRRRRVGVSPAVPYVGGGIGWHRYQETSRFAGSGEDTAETFRGYHVLGGLEWRVARLIGVAGEAQWTAVPDALGTEPTSVAAAFGEKDLGGMGVRVRVVIGR